MAEPQRSRSRRRSRVCSLEALAELENDLWQPGGAAQDQEEQLEIRRGLWTVDEDRTLVNCIADHGEGRWNFLARAAGLKRTGKQCQMRWRHYLQSLVKSGNFLIGMP